MYRLPKFLPLLFVMLTTSTGSAHDVWVNTHTPIVRTGENVYIDLRLGNHGNHHRDFKLAGRITLDWVSLDHIAPGGQRTDIKGKMFATASAEKEGYWTTPLAVHQPGVHCVVETLDRVMNHGKSIRQDLFPRFRLARLSEGGSPCPSKTTRIAARIGHANVSV